MSDNEFDPTIAVGMAEEIIKSQDEKEFDVKAELGTYFIIAAWLVDVSDTRRKIFTDPDSPGSIPKESYEETLYPQLLEKFFRAPLRGVDESGKATISLSYREIDSLILSALWVNPENGVSEEYREAIRRGDHDEYLGISTKYLGECLEELVKGFVIAGGNDRFGYIEILRRANSRTDYTENSSSL